MSEFYTKEVASFQTLLDFLRFGFSEARKQALYYGHGTDNAWDDMVSLVLGALSLPPDASPKLFDARLSDKEKAMLAVLLHQRIHARVPVPYLTHEAWFCDLPFYVDERVLIPRSPLAELIQNQFEPWVKAHENLLLLDLCTGSGCLAIACAYAFPDALVDAVDLSKDALAVAAINCQKHQVEDVVHLIESDCFDSVPVKAYDLIISNPPYVGHDEMKTLPEEYQHEPVMALEAPDNGLAIVDRILKEAGRYLSDEGILVVEVGNSEEALVAAYPEVPFLWLDFERGGQGIFLLTAEQVKAHF